MHLPAATKSVAVTLSPSSSTRGLNLNGAHRRVRARRRGEVQAQLEPEGLPLRVPQPPKSATLGQEGPSFWLSAEEAVLAQLAALQHNNKPHPGHGLELLYRFADVDPFARSAYFGRSLDLGQFERFRRIVYTKCFISLVNHTSAAILSSLEISEDVWKCRVLVTNTPRKEEHVYEFTMRRRFGGRYDGIWYCYQLLCDGCDDRHVYGVI